MNKCSTKYALAPYFNNSYSKNKINIRKRKIKNASLELFHYSYSNNDFSPLNDRYITEKSRSRNTFYRIESTSDNTEDSRNKYKPKKLIEQTEEMMKEHSLNKTKKNNKLKKYNSDVNNLTCEELNENRQIINWNSNSPNSLIRKLIIKSKEVKVLERLLKEKTMQLKATQEKLNDKNNEIKRIYENLDGEKSNNLKVENIKLNKKIYNLEKEKNEIIKNLEKNISELRIKMNDLNNQLTNFQRRNKELENDNLSLAKDNEDFRQLLDAKTNLSLILKEKNKLEKKCVENYKNEIKNLKTHLSNVIIVLKTLFSKETQIYDKRSVFLNNLNYFFENNNVVNYLDKSGKNEIVNLSSNSDIYNNNYNDEI